MGGRDHPTAYSSIDLVEIATTGNTTDFGDLAFAMSEGRVVLVHRLVLLVSVDIIQLLML